MRELLYEVKAGQAGKLREMLSTSERAMEQLVKSYDYARSGENLLDKGFVLETLIKEVDDPAEAVLRQGDEVAAVTDEVAKITEEAPRRYDPEDGIASQGWQEENPLPKAEMPEGKPAKPELREIDPEDGISPITTEPLKVEPGEEVIPKEPLKREKVAENRLKEGNSGGSSGANIDISGGLCFVRGTLIKTSEGYKPIEDIQPGDKVYSLNIIKMDNKGYKLVTNTYKNIANIFIELTLKKETIKVTETHRFLYLIEDG